MTVGAVIAHSKTVTRRHVDSWTTLKPGDRLTLVEKGMGLPKGARQVVLAVVVIVDVRIEPLALVVLPYELEREGCGHMLGAEFIDMWAHSHGYQRITDGLARLCLPCRRIEWSYTNNPNGDR